MEKKAPASQEKKIYDTLETPKTKSYIKLKTQVEETKKKRRKEMSCKRYNLLIMIMSIEAICC